MSTSNLSQAQMIETLWTRAEIEKVMLNFGRALDTGNWTLYRSCFADRFRVNFERLTGQPEVYVDADLWTRFAEIILSPVRRHHQYSNCIVPIHTYLTNFNLFFNTRPFKKAVSLFITINCYHFLFKIKKN